MANLTQYNPTMVGVPQPMTPNTGEEQPRAYLGGGGLNGLAPLSTQPPMSTPLPPNTTPTPGGSLDLSQFSPANVVNQLVGSFTDSNSPYLQSARRRGIETAGQRGLMNSTIAAGNAERAGIESIQPFVSEAVGLLNAREGRALTRDNMQQQAILSDWLDSNKFNREFNANLSLLPIKSTFDMLNVFQQYAAEKPEIWTPDVLSGSTNFFQRNMFDILNQYFPGTFTRSP